MRVKESDKAYIYERDFRKCYHCGKPIKRHKMTLDHYYPKSLGGTLNYFNLVCSCKMCNRLKRSLVPKDWEVVNINLFKRAMVDGRINIQGLDATNQELVHMTSRVNKIIRNCKNDIFEASGVRFYVRENRMIKMIFFDEETEESPYI